MGISIVIKGDIHKESATVQASGFQEHVISDQNEKEALDMGDGSITYGVKQYFGKEPNDVFLDSNACNKILGYDLFSKFNWEQTKLILTPIKAEITGITSEPKMISQAFFENKTDKTATYHADMRQSVTESTSHTWSSTNTISIGASINCSVELPGAKFGTDRTLSYSYAWGESKTASKAIEIGFESGVSVDLDPGETAIAKLSASQGKMTVRVTYKAYVDGRTAVNYNPVYQGPGFDKPHHFYALPTARVMDAKSLTPEWIFTEDIEIDFHEDAVITLEKGGQEKTIFMSHIASA